MSLPSVSAVTLLHDVDPIDAEREKSGFGSLTTATGNLPLVAMDISGQIEGVLVHTTVCQTFVNNSNKPIEATYIFPLPDRMAVKRFHMLVADREIKGVLKERAQARKDYQQAIRAGHRAAIVEEDRSDVFNLRVGNLPPGEEITVTLTLVGALPIADNEVTFRFPLVVAPRYIPGKALDDAPVGAGKTADTNAVPDASRISPPVLLPGCPNPVRLSLTLDFYPNGLPLSDIRCSLHAVHEAESDDGVRRVVLQAGERLDLDFILRYRIGESTIRPSLVLLPDEDGSIKEGTFALTIVPPEEQQETRPRDIVFVLDRSGSMNGWKMIAARRAVARMVATLTPKDRFLVFAFDNQIETPPDFEKKLVTADDRHRQLADDFLMRVEGRGGTEMVPPLQLATHLLSGGDSSRERVLVLITDAQVGHEDYILRILSNEIRNIRVFALGVGTAVNAGFLRRLTDLCNGSYALAESETRLDEVMDQMHRRIGTPVLTNLRLEAAGFSIDVEALVPNRLPDLFAGSSLCVSGRYSGLPDGSLRLTAAYHDGTPWDVAVPARVSRNPAVAANWARGHVRELEDQFVIATRDRDVLEKKILDTSLRFGVLCRFTAFVAVDDSEIVNPGGHVDRIVQPVETPKDRTRKKDPPVIRGTRCKFCSFQLIPENAIRCPECGSELDRTVSAEDSVTPTAYEDVQILRHAMQQSELHPRQTSPSCYESDPETTRRDSTPPTRASQPCSSLPPSPSKSEKKGAFAFYVCLLLTLLGAIGGLLWYFLS